MASSSCHVNVTEIKHDIFISFRGTDVRRGLLSHLKKELRREKIGFYVDDKLERGDKISSSLLRAIEESQILLVIFSKDYASSKWCLDELVKMMECEERNNMERNKQFVVPIFYKVDPSDVRHQKGDYGNALAEHKKKEDIVKVQSWICALEKVAQLSGFHLNSEMDESDLVDKIVKDVSNKLSKFNSGESNDPTKSNGLVGIDRNILWIKSLLTTKSREVLMLGIWGMGGIGKTTIARVVYDTFSPQYEGCCFLGNVREELEMYQLSSLREKLVYTLLGEENPHIIGRGISNSTKRRLSGMKVLIVLDDVDTPNLLKDCLEPISFGPGSSMIVTSRDKQVFTAGEFHEMRMVKELNFEESLKLFCINAFNGSQPKRGYEELSKRAVAIAKGIPLALKVFGSYFQSKSKDIWECALEKLKKYPDQNIQRVLRLSYDGLDDLEKKIFLDIAFFFREEDKGYVIRQLDTWRFHGACGIEALQEKALITISNDNRIQMHGLIQEMGWEIVRQESTDPGSRSRLRDAVEVYDVIKNNKRTDSIEGMLLDVSQIREVALNVDNLKGMPNLRLLKFYSPLPVEVPTCMRHFVLELDFETVKIKRIRDFIHEMARKIIRAEYMEPGRWSQLWDNKDIRDVLKTNKGTGVVDRMQIPNTATNLRWIELNVEHPMLSLPIMQDFVNVKGSVPDIPKQFSKLPGIPKLANNIECPKVLMTNNLSGSKQLMPLPNPDIGSTLKELMNLGGEVHIKSLHYLFMDGCSVSNNFSVLNKETRPLNSAPSGMETLNSSIKDLGNVRPMEFSVLPKEMRQLNLRDTRMELLNSSTGHFNSLECSEIDGLQLETLPKELPFLRSSYYYRLSNCREQDTGKPKLQVLFDGFRYSERISLLPHPESSLQTCISRKMTKSRLIDTTTGLLCVGMQVLSGLQLINWLGALVLDGCNMEGLPWGIKHLLCLKKTDIEGLQVSSFYTRAFTIHSDFGCLSPEG